MIIGEDDVDVDDRASLVRCQDVPFTVRGAVRDRSVFLALFVTNKCRISRALRTGKCRQGNGQTAGVAKSTDMRRVKVVPHLVTVSCRVSCTGGVYQYSSISEGDSCRRRAWKGGRETTAVRKYKNDPPVSQAKRHFMRTSPSGCPLISRPEPRTLHHTGVQWQSLCPTALVQRR